MSDINEWLLERFTLIADNDQGAYFAIRAAVSSALEDEGVTQATYRAALAEGKTDQWATAVGERVAEVFAEWIEEALPAEGLGRLLITDAIPMRSSDLAYELGVYYLPESGDVEEMLTEDDDDEDDDDE